MQVPDAFWDQTKGGELWFNNLDKSKRMFG